MQTPTLTRIRSADDLGTTVHIAITIIIPPTQRLIWDRHALQIRRPHLNLTATDATVLVTS